MQKGKERSGRPWRGALAALGYLTLLLGADQSWCAGIPGLPPWTSARGGAIEPLEHVGSFDLFHSGRYMGLFASGSRPYGIRDLEGYHLMLCSRGAGWGFSLEWENLRYADYRYDRLCAGAGIEAPHPRMSLALETSLLRDEVGDFPELSRWRINGKALLDCSLFMIAASYPIMDHRGGMAARLGCSAGSDAVALTLRADIIERGLIDLRSGFRLMLSPSAAFMAGYRFETDEISFGFFSRWDWMMVVLSWSHHPVMGQTIAFGVGRLWLY